jgi:hypothetical protein
MNDLPRQQIIALIDKYGVDVLEMSRTFESELHLACPECKGEVVNLVAALRHGVVHYLLVLAEANKLENADLPAQAQRLSAEAGLEEGEAQQAVNTWASIIGKVPIVLVKVCGDESPAACTRGLTGSAMFLSLGWQVCWQACCPGLRSWKKNEDLPEFRTLARQNSLRTLSDSGWRRRDASGYWFPEGRRCKEITSSTRLLTTCGRKHS